jgi:hypothetical protein
VERVYGFGVVLESQLRETGKAEGAEDENQSGEGVMLKRLSLYSSGLTEIRDSPVQGLSWKQYKAARKFMKRHMRLGRDGVFHPLNELMEDKNRVYLCGVFESPRKHRWG